MKNIKHICFSLFFLISLLNSTFAKEKLPITTTLTVHKSEKYGILTVSGIIKAPKRIIWEALTAQGSESCTHTKDILAYDIIKIDKKSKTIEAYYLIDFPWPFKDRWQVLHIKINKKTDKISWKLKMGTIKRNTGYYHLEKIDKYSTRVNYKVEFDPGVKYVPRWIINYIAKLQAPKIIKNIRKCAKKKVSQIQACNF